MEVQSLFPRTRQSVRNDEIMPIDGQRGMDRQNNNPPSNYNTTDSGGLFSQDGSSSIYVVDENEGDADSLSSFSTASASFTDEDVDGDVDDYVIISDEDEPGIGNGSESKRPTNASPLHKNNNFNGYVSDFKLIEKIMSYLNLDSLLDCRLVCQKWCDIISSLLWDKASVIFSRRHLQAGSLCELHKTDLVQRFKCPNFKFYCLDLRHDLIRNFLTIYGTRLKHLSFITCYMSKATFDLILLDCPNLTHLEMNNVPRSVSMCRCLFPRQLQLHFGPVLTKLNNLNLTRLEIPSSLNDLENDNDNDNGGRRTGSGSGISINVSRNKLRMRMRTRQRLLRQRHKIITSSLSKSSLCFKKGHVSNHSHNHNQDPRSMDNYNGENLSSIFLEQLLESCAQIQSISLNGWEGWTLYNLMTLLNSRPQFTTVTELCLIDLRGDVGDLSDPSIFFPLCSQASHLQFKKLTISLKQPVLWKRPLKLTSSPSQKNQNHAKTWSGFSSSFRKPDEDDNEDHDPEIFVPSLCQDFDTIFQLTLHHHRNSLEYLNLTNLPLTLHIFKDSSFPRLKSLCLLSLRITDLEWRDRMDRLSKFMPKLEIIDFCPMPQTQSRTLSFTFENSDLYPTNKDGYFTGALDRNGNGCWKLEEFFRGFKNPLGDFYRCTPFDFICLTSVMILYGLVAILLLVSQFNYYGEYFLGFGLWILVMLCLSDFYSETWTNLQIFHT